MDDTFYPTIHIATFLWFLRILLIKKTNISLLVLCLPLSPSPTNIDQPFWWQQSPSYWILTMSRSKIFEKKVRKLTIVTLKILHYINYKISSSPILLQRIMVDWELGFKNENEFLHIPSIKHLEVVNWHFIKCKTVILWPLWRIQNYEFLCRTKTLYHHWSYGWAKW